LAFGRRLAARLGAGDCVALSGQLGAGKTILVRGIAEGLGLEDKRMVSSPTFVLVQEYPCRVPVHHVDLYRLPAPAAELSGLGIDEMLERGVVVIEWAERAGSALPRPRWQIDIEVLSPTARRFRLRRVE
jgi:tRNA threonylcarbamoyl adenosine modification protein YjeE